MLPCADIPRPLKFVAAREEFFQRLGGELRQPERNPICYADIKDLVSAQKQVLSVLTAVLVDLDLDR